jgi:hypothetical protein
MSSATSAVRCRIAACREDLNDGRYWSIYLINDSDSIFNSATLDCIATEWGNQGHSEVVDSRITDLAPRAHALLWRDNGDNTEFRMELSVSVQVNDIEARLTFEFPKLYIQRNLPLVAELGKVGYQVSAQGHVKL